MQIEAIISYRNELSHNVNRTLAGLKGHGIKATIIEDHPSMGCGWRRHLGILASMCDVVFICDAHMEFSEGYFEYVRQHLVAHPNDITVSRMQSLDHNWQPFSGQVYAAAEIQTCIKDAGEQFFPIAGKWRRTDPGIAPVGCAMGACYGMKRERYHDMGEPLGILRAWGMDEEILSIACWMTGGRVHLIDGLAYHVFAAPKAEPGPLSPDETARIWANRAAVISAIPMEDSERGELVDWLRRTDAVQVYRDAINQSVISREDEINRLYERLSTGPLSWSDYVKMWCNNQKEPTKKEIQMRRTRARADQIRRRPAVSQSANVKSVKTPPNTKRPYTQSARVIDPGVPCNHCGHRYDHTITNTYPNGNRRRICGNPRCGKPFISSMLQVK